MDKQTKMYVGLGVAAVAGYLIYNQWKKKQTTTVVTTASGSGSSEVAPSVAKMTGFAGLTADSVVGERKGMVGMDATQQQNAVVKDSSFAWGSTRSFSAQNEMVKDGSWANQLGKVSNNFFDVRDSKNSYRNR
jgi:hypothetical protein